MFRFAVILSLCLLVAFTGAGLLVSREWGWPEYASDELYVVYIQFRNYRDTFFIANADGTGKSEQLTGIFNIRCSPDGRILAYFTDNLYLYVLDANEVIYSREMNQAWSINNVANDGTVSLSDTKMGNIVVDKNIVKPLTYGTGSQYAIVAYVGSNGFVLWDNFMDGTLALYDTAGKVNRSFLYGLAMRWLGEEHLFAFVRPLVTSRSGSTGDVYLGDVTTENIVLLKEGIDSMIFSPDGTRSAASQLSHDTPDEHWQVVTFDTLTNQNFKQITFDKDTSSSPICFLTFRPQMLLANPQ